MAGSPIKKLSKVFAFTPVIGTGIYAANQIVGGITKLPDFFESLSGVSEIMNVAINDIANQKIIGTIFIFTKKPAGTYTDGAAFAPSQADLNLIGAVISVPAANYFGGASSAVGDVGNIRKKVKSPVQSNQIPFVTDAKSAYLVFVTGGTPTYGAANAIQIQIGIEQDV